MQKIKITLLAVLTLVTTILSAAPVTVVNGDRLAILGDSITEQKIYSVYIAAYLMACSGLQEVRVFQFGWSGERAAGMVDRMYNDVISWNPTVMTTCYGMNDGSYRKYEPAIGNIYRDNLQKIIEVARKHNARIVIGTPGIVDADTFIRSNLTAAEYNANLAELAKIAETLAEKYQTGFANIYALMSETAAKAKAKLGKKYHVSGKDGIHPGPNGQLVMAYAFLKALGMDGKIAQIKLDFATGTATASAGHRVLKQSSQMVEIESSRYPFCFPPPSDLPDNPAGILQFLPFQQDLNRFELQVINFPKAQAMVKWGESEQRFSREELERGINLAAAFPTNPFSSQFDKLTAGILAKQQLETWMIKKLITHFRNIKQLFPECEQDAEMQAAILYWRRKLHERESGLFLNCQRLIIPIQHQISITPTN